MKAICNLDVLVDSKASKYSSPTEEVPQGKKPGARYDHIFAGTDPHVLADQTKSVSEGLETVITQPTTEKGASSTAIHGDKEEASSTIKLEDLTKLVSQIPPSFKDLDLPKDDPVIIVDESDKDEPNVGIEDTLVPRFSSPMSSKIQELTNQVLILQSQKHKLELEKNKAEAEAALLKAQPSFPNVEQLKELLVKSLQTEFSKILSSRDFSRSFPTELKNLPSKFNKLTEEIKGLKTQVHELEIKLPKELKEIPTKLEDFTNTATSITSQVAELKTLQWELPEEFISLPTKSTSTKAGDQSVPSAGQANTMPAEEEKDTNQATISHLFQRRAEKIAKAEKENLNQLPKPTTPPATTPINPSIITTQMQTPLQSPPRSSSQPEGKYIKKDKGKKVMSLEEVEKESTKSDSNKEAHMTGSMVKSSKKLEEEAKAEVATLEGEVRKAEQIDLLGLEVVHKYYNYKLQYDRYCDKKLNRRAESRITNCDDPLDKLNDLANKKRKYADDIHDYFKVTKRLKSSVQYGDHLLGTVLNKPVLGPGVDDHARTFSSLLLAKVDKRNLNPLKQMRTIKQLRQQYRNHLY
ncbi:hypothetical protein Tco_1113064 [Tanacetum coccineum]|uniref:Uncharacterized protein n=1 Tax=Tanacetum coccineum TaxID=301880 RepID=A0ABQ5IR28_9ASTR